MLLGTEFCLGATAARRGPVRIPVRARGGQRDLGQGCRRTALRVQTEECRPSCLKFLGALYVRAGVFPVPRAHG